MLFLSSPGSMANVFLRRIDSCLDDSRPSSNILLLPFLFAVSFPVFLFFFSFFCSTIETKDSIAGNNVVSIDFVGVVPRVVYFIYLLEGYWKPDTA